VRRNNANFSSTFSRPVSALSSLSLPDPFPTTNNFLQEYFVDVEDVAILHLIALINPDVKSERVFAYAEPWNWNQMLAIFRKNFPDKKFHDDFPGIGKDITTIAQRDRAVGLLKEFGRDGFTGLEESLLRNVEGVGA
jgi:hypothetical protein